MSLAKEQAAESRVVREGLSGSTLHTELMIRAVYCAVVALASGCTAMIDTDRQQCSVVDDCMKKLGDERNFLEQPLSFTCEQHVCREQTQCQIHQECSGVAGKPLCQAGYCVACNINSDCPSPTATCNKNVCEDVKWGCLKEVDNRPATEPKSSFSLGVTSALTMMPPTELGVRVCRASGIDPTCVMGFDGTTGRYDVASGMVTVEGIPHGTLYHLQLVPAMSSGLTERDFYTNRTARGTEKLPDGTKIVPLSILAGLATPKPVDIKRPLISVRVFDCQGAPASDVTVAITSPAQMPDLLTAYLTASNEQDYEADRTTVMGQMGFLNVTPGVLTTLTASLKTATGAYELFNFQLVPQAARTSQVDLYPRSFTAQ